MNIKETLSAIRKKYRAMADEECRTTFSNHYCQLFDVNFVEKTTSNILIIAEKNYCVSNIEIDNYNNLNCKSTFMPPVFLTYFRIILNNHFEDEDQCYYLRLGSHFFINYFQQHELLIDDDYLGQMLAIDDRMPKQKGGLSFREWLLGRNNDGRGQIHRHKLPLIKNLVNTKEGWTWQPTKDDCEICKGASGGVKGNENIIEGQVVCDYCSAKMRKAT